MSAKPYDAPLKVCPKCYVCSPSAQRVCHSCGHEFYPARKVRLK